MIKKYCDEIENEIIEIRREIHKNPELGFEELETSGLICRTLDKWGIPYKKMAKTGVVADICGKGDGKAIILRADIDALPVTEETGLPFASQKEGLMHACGHDAHTAVLLGCAYVLSKIKDNLCGSVRLVFQPAEEGIGGALPMINEGVLENPKITAAAALHVSADAPAGKIMIKNGAVMASIDEFDVILRGRGGHAGHPDKNIDPIVIAGEFITSLQTIVSRNIPPSTPAVISVTSVNGGVNYNVIPDEVHIKGTIRCSDPKIREMLPQLVEKKAEKIAEASGGSSEFVLRRLYPPTISSAEINEFVTKAAEKTIGAENIIYFDECSMGGEDFAYFSEKVPSTYFNLGIANEEKGIIYPIHNSKFTVDESALKTGVEIMSQLAAEYLNGGK